MGFDRISNLPSDGAFARLRMSELQMTKDMEVLTICSNFFVHLPRIRRFHIENYLLNVMDFVVHSFQSVIRFSGNQNLTLYFQSSVF